MDVDSDRTIDSDELEDFIHSQQKSKVTKSKGLKDTKLHDILDCSKSSNRMVKKKLKKLDVTNDEDFDTDRTVDSDELKEFIAQSQKEKKKVPVKTVLKKTPRSVYKEISDSDSGEGTTKKKFHPKIQSKKPQSQYKEIPDSILNKKVEKKKGNVSILSKRPQPSLQDIFGTDSEDEVKKKKVDKKVSNKRPLSKYKEISDSDSGEEVHKEKVSENILNKKPKSKHKDISDSDSDSIVNKKKVNENILNKKPKSNYKEISDSDSDEIVNKRKVNENILNKKPKSNYKEISDSDSDEIVYKKKVNENILNKKSNDKEFLDPIEEIRKKKKIDKNSPNKKREKCRYGKRCYRKNPDHIKNFDHGDSDDLKDQEKMKPNKNFARNPAFANKQPMSQNEKDFNQKKESQRKELDYRGNANKATYAEKPGSSKVPNSSRNQGSTSFDCKNYNFYLTKVNGIPPKYNSLAYDIKDLLSFKDGTLISSAQFNYLFDIPWLVRQYPDQYKKCPITVVHGEQRQSKKALEAECAPFPNIKLCQAKLDIPFGTHHTKMMFLLYKEGFKIVIHTSNIVDSDWDQRTQGMWISDMLPELKNASATEGESPTNFKADLLEYITAYGAPGLEEWLQVIKKHDFSSIRVVLIASVPGRFVGSKKVCFGHLKLRKVLNLHGSTKDTVSPSWPVICQFSSIGSLGASPNQWMTGEFGTSLSTVKDTPLSSQSSNLKLVFPTVENVRKSLQGYPAGQSLPYSINVAEKQTYLKSFMHQWKSEKLGRTEASPHIKTYLRVSPDNTNIAWFLLTSANLSKAAWGSLEKKDTQLMIRSYELGVLYLPKFFGLDTFSTPSSTKTDLRKMFPVPYDIPLEPYSQNDEPWIWDIPHVHAPDRYGMKWCPPLK